jgi:hypothetical protein
MNALLACVTLYVAALCVWIWLARPVDEPPPAFVPIDIRFCQDWRDGHAELCERIPFRKEVAV